MYSLPKLALLISLGEVIRIRKGEIKSCFYTRSPKDVSDHLCAMEYIYFSRPDSNLEGINVHAARKRAGKVLFEEAPAEADVVIGVPDSSLSAATGYAEASGIPYEMGQWVLSKTNMSAVPSFSQLRNYVN